MISVHIRAVASGGQWCPAPTFDICAPPFHVWPLVAPYIQYCILKMWTPLLVFGHNIWFLALLVAKSWRWAWFTS